MNGPVEFTSNTNDLIRVTLVAARDSDSATVPTTTSSAPTPVADVDTALRASSSAIAAAKAGTPPAAQPTTKTVTGADATLANYIAALEKKATDNGRKWANEPGSVYYIERKHDAATDYNIRRVEVVTFDDKKYVLDVYVLGGTREEAEKAYNDFHEKYTKAKVVK